MSNLSLMLVCHGSPDPRYLSAFEQFVAQCQAALAERIYAGILESDGIPLSVQMAQMAEQDPDALVIPLFMGRSGHVNQDIPQAMAGCTTLKLAPALGQHPAFWHYLQQQLQADPTIDGWILWAHGSKSGDFAPRFCAQIQPISSQRIPVLPAFYVNSPNLDTQLDCLISQGCQQIGILPLLLFPGGLIDQLEAIAQTKRSCKIGIRVWPHLAADPGLVDVVRAVAHERLGSSSLSMG